MTRLAPALLACLALFGAGAPAAAESPPDNLVRAELLGGWRTAEGVQMAGLRLVLAPGWKTYWRAPGDAGIPPAADWTGSGNLASVRLHFPRPEVFEVSGLRTLGYARDVVLPIEITPADPTRAVELEGEIGIGVCAEICVPVTLRLSAPLPMPGGPDAAITAALAARPDPLAPALRCRVEPLPDGLRLTAVIDHPPIGPAEVAVIETDDPRVWVSEATAKRDAGALTVSADLVPPEARPFALDRGRVTITLISGDAAVEIRGCPAG
jgi:DsbC/DsbD-like thiol-disulfide interchange protein